MELSKAGRPARPANRSKQSVQAICLASLTAIIGLAQTPRLLAQSPATAGPSQWTSAAPADAQISAATTRIVYAASCEFDAVNAAVNVATDNITVAIPAGECSWGALQLNVPAGVFLRGAGRDATIIRRIGTVPNTNYLIAYDCANGRRAEFSSMTLVGNGNGAIQDKGLGLLNGCVDFKVFDAQFNNFIFSAVYVGNSARQRGVIYRNRFIDNYSPELRNLGYGVVVYGGGNWPPLELGTENAVFVEDNYFSGNRHNIASNNGSVYVFRHNTVVGRPPAKDFAMTDAHGLSSSPLGSRSVEIYGNNYATEFDGEMRQRTAIGIRGGDGVIFDNIVAATIARPVELSVEGPHCGSYPIPGQIHALYIWNNPPNEKIAQAASSVANDCPASIKLDRDYFLFPLPGYKPFAYPHPLRAR